MATVSADINLYLRLGAWLIGVVGSSEVGETTVVGGTMRNVTADTNIGYSAIELSYGIMSSGPTDRVAETGTLSFALNNGPSNSTGQAGAYSPGHTHGVAGYDLGVECLLTFTYSGTTYYKFSGTLVSVVPSAGQYREQITQCEAVDWMDEAAISKVKGLTVAENKRSDECIQLLIDESVAKQPNAVDLSVGQSTFKTAFDNLLDAQTSVLRSIADATISELGYAYIKGDTTQGGTFRFEDRHSRPKAGVAVGTFSESMVGLEVQRTREDLINTVYVNVHPRTEDASATVLYELTTTDTQPSVTPGESVTLNCPYREASINAYRVAAIDLVPLASGTDWIANSAADGSGSNLTSSVVVEVVTQAANSTELKITNNHATLTAYLTTLQIRGNALKDVSETVLSATDTSSAFSYGERDARIDMKYESDTTLGLSIAQWILNIYSSPAYRVASFTLAANTSAYMMTQSLAREPGDKVTFAESQTGIATTGASGAEIGFFINGVSMTISPGGIINTSWVLSPSSAQSAWVLDQVGASELGISTALGFA